MSSFIQADISIAVSKSSEIDLLSAKLLCIFSDRDKNSIKCDIKQKDFPIKSLKNSNTTFTIAKGNQVFEASKTMPKLRSIAALYPELLTFISQKDSNISSLLDKKIKVAYVGDDTKELLSYIYKKLDLNISTLVKIDQNQTSKMLKDAKIDAYIGLYEYPSKAIKKEISKTDIRLIQLGGKVYSQLIRSNSFFLKSKLKKELYNIQEHDINTIGVKTILLTTKDCDERVVYEITKAILDNLDKFKKLHPIYKNISKKDLLEELVIPQHNGAIKAFNNMKEDEKL